MQDNISLRYIPQELKMNALWCCWKYTPNPDGVVVKKPFNVATGYGAKSNDPSTFVSYPALLSHLHEYLIVDEDGKQRGGVGLGIFRGYSAIDIDHCVDDDGNINEMAREIIDFCQSYTEYSPSKTGIRIIFKTNVLIDKSQFYINNQNIGLEIYISDNTNKFVTITGNKISGDTINEVDITYILQKYMRRDAFNLQKILKKDAKFNELWNAVAPGSHANENELDAALCCKLAYYLKNDENEIDKYFRMSPYYGSKDAAHKSKWNRDDYRLTTIRGAISIIQTSITTTVTNPVTIKKKYELNDTGNARRFVDKFGSVLHYNVENKLWMIWNGRYWQYDVKEKIKDYVEILAEEMMLEVNQEQDLDNRARLLRNINHIYNSAGKEALLKEARHMDSIPVVNDDFDNDTYRLCCDNGVINLKTGEIDEAKKEDMMSMSTGCEIDLDNEPTVFLKFFEEMFQGNQTLMHYVHKALGYSMTNSTREQCMFILKSEGNSGKSLLLDIIKTALGGYGITSNSQLITDQKFGSNNSEEIARLKGKRIIIIDEVESGDKLNEKLVKNMTGGIGNMVGRFLYANSFELLVTGKIWLSTNYEPVIRGTDRGIWRRINIINIYSDFTGQEDKDLREKLLRELPQILGWLFKGYKMYVAEGLEMPEEVQQSIKEYKADNDIVQKWINECCECEPAYFEQASVLFENFNAWCRRGKEFEMSNTMFGRNLSKKYEKRCYSGRNVYIGIRLKKGEENLAKKVDYDRIKVDENI